MWRDTELWPWSGCPQSTMRGFQLHYNMHYFMKSVLYGRDISANGWWHLLESFLQNWFYEKGHAVGNQGFLEPDFPTTIHLLSCTSLKTEYIFSQKCYYLEGEHKFSSNNSHYRSIAYRSNYNSCIPHSLDKINLGACKE